MCSSVTESGPELLRIFSMPGLKKTLSKGQQLAISLGYIVEYIFKDLRQGTLR